MMPTIASIHGLDEFQSENFNIIDIGKVQTYSCWTSDVLKVLFLRKIVN